MDSERGNLIQRPNSNQSEQAQNKKVWTKKKKAFVGFSSIVVVAAIILLIVLLVKKKSDDNSDDDPDNGGDNNFDDLNYQEYNPFSIPVDSPVQSTVFYYNGLLKNSNYSQSLNPDLKNLKNKFKSIEATEMKYKPVDPSKVPIGANNQMKEYIQFNFSLVNNYESRIQIGAVNGSNNYSVTNETSPRIVQEFEARFTQLGFNISGPGQPFGWSMRNIYNNETILNTTNRKLIVQDKYSEIGFVLPNDNIFGLGIANRQFKLKINSTYTLWAKGRQEENIEIDLGYGAQQSSQVLPFVLGQTNNKNDWYGIFFVGSAAQSFELIYVPNKTQVIFNYITLSDQLELYVIMRGTPKQIIQRYQHQIGYPSLPPFYALGIFAGSQKSQTWSKLTSLETQIDNYNKLNLPIDGVLLDQYTEENIYPFTQDTLEGFGNVRDFQTYLQSQNMYMILGIQSQIPQNSDGSPIPIKWQNGIQGSCINSSINCTLGYYNSMTSETQFPVGFINVFNNQSAYDFYDEAFNYLNISVSSFDGIYLRGNTPFIQSTFNSSIQSKSQGFLEPQNPEIDGQQDQPFNNDQSIISYDNFPYIPGYLESGKLTNNTIDTGFIHQGFENTSPSHLNGVPHQFVHNTYGFVQHKIIWNTLLKNSTRRPNIYSESAWAGTGFYGGSFNQPLEISWESLQNSVSMAMTAGINGINNWVTEVCGVESFGGNLTDLQLEICTRWVELAVYLPMIRIKGDLSDYIVSYPDQSTNIISALNQRLPITRYIYSQMFANNYTGGSLVYPLYFDYPNDDQCLQNIEQTFMLGDTLKISPVMNITQDGQFTSYFPAGNWRSLNNFTQVINTSTGGSYQNLSSQLGMTQVHIKDGKILPWQKSDTTKVQRTHDMTQEGISLIVNRDDSNYADGYVLVDDGITQSNFANNLFTFWKIRFAEKAINFWVERGDYLFDISKSKPSQKIDQLNQIQILGASDLNDSDTACYMGKNLQPVQMNINYNESSDILTIQPTKAVAFRNLGIIKFYNSKTEPNVCIPSTFQYSSNQNMKSNDTYWEFYLTPQNNNGDLKNLYATFQLMDDEGTINFNLTYQDDFENAYKNIFRPINVVQNSQYDQSKVTQKLEQYLSVQNQPFAFDISLNGEVIYSLNGSKLFMSDYLVMDAGIFNMNPLNKNPLMGMGERAGDLFFQNETDGIHSRWSHDAANPIDDGLPPGRNMYGFQPFYVYQSGATNFPWVGVFNNNPYATDYIVNTNNGKQANITTITIGGAIEKWFFIGQKPDSVIIKYEKLTGMPTMPPLWSFGWQQCRFGWVNDQVWLQVVQNYSNANLPLDTMWADIDYMDDYKVFTISPVTYGNLSNQVKDIRSRNMTFVPIMDAGVAVRNEPYFALDTGKDMGIFIKQAYSDNPLTAGVWCGNAYFPDFYNPKAESYWHQMFDKLFNDNDLQFDGIWLDMNEATNFCDGYCITDERPKNSLRNKPFYVPGSRDLENESLGVDGVHYADQNLFNRTNLTEYDVHNTFSLMQVKATATYLQSKGLRPYVLSRSNFQGIQKYGFHWLGDNWSWVEYMVASVKNIYEYQLFGLPFMGCDLCGFNGDAPSDLCTRWHQVGTLFPFARNHNQNATKPQEPYRFTDYISSDSEIKYVDLIRTAILNRYTMLRYYYSSFWSINQYGGSFFKPLFFEFPSDPNAYIDIEINMLLGNSLKASVEVRRLPSEAEGQINESAFYFPNGTWCQILPFVANSWNQCIGDGTKEMNVTLKTGIEDYYVHMRNGFIIPLQNSTQNENQVNNTKDQLNLYTDLYILPNSSNSDYTNEIPKSYNGAAQGFIYFDDGVSTDSYQKFSRIDFNYQFDYTGNANIDAIQFYQINNNYFNGTKSERIGNITIFGTFKNQTATRLPNVQAQLINGTQIDLEPYYIDQKEQGGLGQILTFQLIDKSSQENLYFKDLMTITIDQTQQDIFQDQSQNYVQIIQ